MTGWVWVRDYPTYGAVINEISSLNNIKRDGEAIQKPCHILSRVTREIHRENEGLPHNGIPVRVERETEVAGEVGL